MTWFSRLRLRSGTYSLSNNLEYLGEDFINRVTTAARKERWGRTVIQLAWTAGPVTYLALQGGYLMGYGKNAPSDLFIYFAIYTVIAGAFAVLMRFLYQLTRGQEIEKSEAALSYTLVHLPDLILYARNQTLLYYDEENRKLLAAKYLLENPDSLSETVRAAVQDVTGDSVLARTAQRIESFRRNGLSARIADERSEVAERLERAVEEVKTSSQAVVDLLERRFSGRPPSRQTGRTRTEGFIGRVLVAGEKHDFDAMTLNDTEEVYTLAYELLAGRSIPLFSLRYTGSKEFTETSEYFDRARLAFRKAAYVRNSKLRGLAELFAESDTVEIVPAAAPIFTTVELMYGNILKALDELFRDLKKRTGPQIFQRRRRNAGPELRKRFMQLDNAIRLHHSLRAANNQLNKRYEALRRAEQKYLETKEHSAKNFPLHLLRPGEHGRGIRIVEKNIELSKNSRMRLARDVESFIRQLEKKPSPHTNDYKKLAVDIAIKLEAELKISRFEVQYAIESSNAPYLSSLEIGMSASSKAGLAVSLVRDVQKNMHTPIHRLAHVLVNYHGMPLSRQSIDFLVQRYGANPERLEGMLPDIGLDLLPSQPSGATRPSEAVHPPGTVKPSEPVQPLPSGTALKEGETGKIKKAGPDYLLQIERLSKKYQDLLDYAVKAHII